MASLKAFQQLQELDKKNKVEKKVELISDKRKTLLSVGINQQKFYIDTSDVGEVMHQVKTSLVGHTASWFRGLVKVQGDIYSLIDIAPFLEFSPVSEKSTYVVALAKQYENVAIVVDNLFGLFSVEEVKDKKEKGYFNIYQTDKGEVSVLSVKRLVESDKFSDISVFSN